MRVKKFYNDTYHQTFYFICGCSESEGKKQINKICKTKFEWDIEGALGSVIVNGGFIFIWLKSEKKNAENLGFLCHESYHATSALSFHRGLVADFRNDEPQAYLSQFIFDNCYKALR